MIARSQSAYCLHPWPGLGRACRDRASVLGHSLDTRGEAEQANCHSWVCRRGLGGDLLAELRLPDPPEARTLVDPTLSLALKYGTISLKLTL